MGDIQTRPFSKNYSGLVNQTVIGIGLTVLCVTGQELMKRMRRKGMKKHEQGLGSRESWEFGYLYQGRSWARFPSPPTPAGWPFSWVGQVIRFPESKMNELRGIDATLYIRFLRGCFWFALLQSLTTFPILFPIHVEFSPPDVSRKSMTRASISSLVGTEKGLSLLWIHICLLFWITLSWIGILLWIANGAFKFRAANIAATSRQETTSSIADKHAPYYQHPHPQYNFIDIPSLDRDRSNKGLRLRTIMVSNVPPALRNEKDLKEKYFEYYMSRKVEKPSLGLTSSTQPGFFNKSFAFLFNRAKRLPAHMPPNPLTSLAAGNAYPNGIDPKAASGKTRNLDVPVIERVIVARKMTELASLLSRREEILRLLETAHIKLANKSLLAVKAAMDRQRNKKPISHHVSRTAAIMKKRRSLAVDTEIGESQEGTLDEEARMNQMIEVLGGFVEIFTLENSLVSRSKKAFARTSKQAFRKFHIRGSEDSGASDASSNGLQAYPPTFTLHPRPEGTIWEALLSLPRSSLDPYQPLINLSHLFRGKTVPSIDYYTAKLNLLTSLIKENRSKAVHDYDPVSTAFVTFSDPADARRACKYLAVHPNNPLACLVTMAPAYQDLDWIRVMKSTMNAEFVKDWVVNIGVWAFTLFWLFPVSLLVGLVSIQNISLFWPSLKLYLDRHEWESEVIQSFLPTILVALLAILIPLILLLIAKKAHTITTLSGLHDQIMTRYYKFLVVNVLVFFCVGTAALQSVLQLFIPSAGDKPDLLKIVTNSFPTAGPFYVGWLIFTTAMHAGFELLLLGLPLIMYPSTSRQVTPRKRSVGVRPRTFNFYYWLPNHLLVVHVLFLFAVFNPFVLPFATLYFFVQSGVVKNQLLHVYAKQYEANGQVLLIRIIRYSLDGLVLAQAVFLAYMVVLKKSVNVGLAAFLIFITALLKLYLTRICRAQFEQDDITEAEIVCGKLRETTAEDEAHQEENPNPSLEQEESRLIPHRTLRSTVLKWPFPEWLTFSYSSTRQRRSYTSQQPNLSSHHNQSQLRSHDDRTMVEIPRESAPRSDYPGDARSTVPENSVPPLNIDAHDLDLSPVITHPPPVVWDDQANVDLPYDNPFYTREISNVLWLPRNPSGILDLDDTVDLKTSLTVEGMPNALGVWVGESATRSLAELTQVSSPTYAPQDQASEPDSGPAYQGSILEVDGTEEIELPVAIAKRVEAKEADIEQTNKPLRPMATRRRLSSAEKSTLSVVSGKRRRPSVLDERQNSSGYRSFSDRGPSRARSSSIMSALQPPRLRLERTRSSDFEFGLRSDTQAQEDLVADTTRSHVSLNPPSISRAQNVTALEAIIQEVLAEEKDALLDRLHVEHVEATKAKSTKSWLTSWMFRKTTH